MNKPDDIEYLILETLSYYEAMSFEKIILDIPMERAKSIPDFTREKLLNCLENLIRRKVVRKSEHNKELLWIKVFPKRKNRWWPF